MSVLCSDDTGYLGLAATSGGSNKTFTDVSLIAINLPEVPSCSDLLQKKAGAAGQPRGVPPRRMHEHEVQWVALRNIDIS